MYNYISPNKFLDALDWLILCIQILILMTIGTANENNDVLNALIDHHGWTQMLIMSVRMKTVVYFISLVIIGLNV